MALRALRILAGIWALIVAGPPILIIPSTYGSVGPLSRVQVAAIDFTWTLSIALFTVVGLVAMLSDVRVGRPAVVAALGLATLHLLALPLISPFSAARSYPSLTLLALANVIAAVLLEWSYRAARQPESN